jgi:penicillin-binding protein 2
MDFDQEIIEALSRRLGFLKFFVFLVFLIIFVRLFYLQVVKGDYFFDLSQNNRIKIQEIPAPRGVIYDRNGKVLKQPPSFDVSLLYSGINQQGNYPC